MNTTVNVHVVCEAKDGQWIARALRNDNGDPFGIECTGATKDEAIDSLQRWLDWQHEHAAALEALQQAERAYHRTVAGGAFSTPTDGVAAVELQEVVRETLEAVEAARVRLDEIRSRKP